MAFSKLRFSRFKEFGHQVSFGELQLTMISLTFKTSCCNLKIRGLGGKLCVAFLFFSITFLLKSKIPYILLKKNINLSKNKRESNHTVF